MRRGLVLMLIPMFILALGFQPAVLGCWPKPEGPSLPVAKGANNAPVRLTINGSGFAKSVEVKLTREGQPDIAATDVMVFSENQVLCTVDLTGAAVGAWDVTITNQYRFLVFNIPNALTMPGAFSVEYAMPTVASIEPKSALNTEKATVAITGSGFRAGVKAELVQGGQRLSAEQTELISDTQVKAVFNLNGAATGAYTVTVTNDDGKTNSLAAGFAVLAPEMPAPDITGISPADAKLNAKLTVEIAGANFAAGALASLSNEAVDIAATEVSVESAGKIKCVFDLAGQPAGLYNVVVLNPDGQEAILPDGFSVTSPAPAITGVSPDKGANNGSILVAVEGAGFVEGLEIKLTQGDVEVTGANVKLVSAAKAECFFNLDGKPDGKYQVIVTNPDGQQAILAGAFTVEAFVVVRTNRVLKPIFFDVDSWAIRPDQLPVLDENIDILKENPKLYVILGGHADERGSSAYNLQLTAKRAEAVKEYLVAHGIEAQRIIVYAYGEDAPARPGHGEEAWQYNRRVDTLAWETVLPKDEALTAAQAG